MKSFELPNYTVLNEALNKTSFTFHPAELHGLICGFLCQPDRGFAACEELMKANKLNQGIHQALKDLYAVSEQQLKDFLFEFQLVLPDDEEELPIRAEALTSWCQGFLTGLKLSGVEMAKGETNEVTEAINDITEIAKMNYEDVVASEEDETAYVELVEFVRMAVILIYQDLHSISEDGDSENFLH